MPSAVSPASTRTIANTNTGASRGRHTEAAVELRARACVSTGGCGGQECCCVPRALTAPPHGLVQPTVYVHTQFGVVSNRPVTGGVTGDGSRGIHGAVGLASWRRVGHAEHEVLELLRPNAQHNSQPQQRGCVASPGQHS